jgi:hypothetical protein
MRWVQWRNYYGFGPGKPGGPQPQCAKWGPPGSGCRAKTLAREASDMLQCRFLTIRILKNLSLKSGKRHFRDSRFKNFPGEHALDPLENSCARLVPLAFLLGGPSKILNRGPPDITYVTPLDGPLQGPVSYHFAVHTESGEHRIRKH